MNRAGCVTGEFKSLRRAIRNGFLADDQCAVGGVGKGTGYRLGQLHFHRGGWYQPGRILVAVLDAIQTGQRPACRNRLFGYQVLTVGQLEGEILGSRTGHRRQLQAIKWCRTGEVESVIATHGVLNDRGTAQRRVGEGT